METEEASRIKLVVGLGNPGRKYAKTRHNVGFMVVEALAERWGFTSSKGAFGGVVCDGRVSIAGHNVQAQRVMLLEPHTYMNLSGQAVKGLVNFYKIDPEDVLVVMDDLALPLGRIRVRSCGSAGGHKGLANIQMLLSTSDIARLRIGINQPPEYMDAADFVLQKFGKDEIDIIEQAVRLAQQAIEDWLCYPLGDVMGKYNGITLERKVEDE